MGAPRRPLTWAARPRRRAAAEGAVGVEIAVPAPAVPTLLRQCTHRAPAARVAVPWARTWAAPVGVEAPIALVTGRPRTDSGRRAEEAAPAAAAG